MKETLIAGRFLFKPATHMAGLVGTAVLLLTGAINLQAQTPVYQWTFDGGSGTGVPPITAGGGTLTTGGTTASFGGPGVSGAATDFAFTNNSSGIATNNADISGLGTNSFLTVTFWMKASVAYASQSQVNARLLMVGSSLGYDEGATGSASAPGGLFTFALNTGTNLQIGVGPSITPVVTGAFGPYSAGQWVFVAFEYDGSTGNAFFNPAMGTAIGNSSKNGALFLASTNSSIGVPTMMAITTNFSTSYGILTNTTSMVLQVGNRANLGRGFQGSIDSINIYTNQLLTPAQLEAVRIYTMPTTVTLTNSDAATTSSFNAAGQWSNALAPNSLTDYLTGTNGLRTPTNAVNYIFGGHSLTLNTPSPVSAGGSGYSLLFAGTGSRTYTIDNLVLAGGLLRSGSDASSTCVLAGGALAVSSNSTIVADQSSFLISAPLSGIANLTNNGAGFTNIYSGTNNAFTGRLILGTNAFVQFNSTSSVPGNPGLSTVAQITALGASTLIDAAGVSLTNANGGITVNAPLTISTATNTIIGERVTGAGGLIKTGSGLLTLTGSTNLSHVYTGDTTISGGTLALSIGSTITNITSIISNSVTITVGSGANFDVTGVVNGFRIASGQTLMGAGTNKGPVTADVGATLRPGLGGTDTSTLNFNNTLTLSGTTVLALNRANGQNIARITGVTTLTKGGTLTLTNVGSALQGGDTFGVSNAFSATTQSGVFTVTNLPTLTAGQNWWTTNNSATLIVNQVMATNVTYTRAKGLSLKIAITNLMSNVASLPAGGDTFTFTGVGASTNGATITTNGTYIFYIPSTGASSNANESFSYSVSDSRGGSAGGVINISVVSATSASLSFVKVGGTATLSLFGIPHYTYVLQTATNLNGPWSPLFTNSAGSDGTLNFIDPNATNLQQFYRTAQP